MPGMLRSATTTSKPPFLNCSAANLPSQAVVTANPARVRMREYARTRCSSSSTTRTLAPAVPTRGMLSGPTVSLRSTGHLLMREDVGSTNGTRVAGRKLDRGERAHVAIGTVFELGSATFVLQKTRGLPKQPGPQEAALARATASRVAIDDDAPPSSKAPPSSA